MRGLDQSNASITDEIRKEFDQRLLTLRLHKPSLRMHEEVNASSRKIYAEYARRGPQRSDLYIRLIDSALAILETYLDVVDRLSREVWRVQGKTITPEFINAIPHMLILDIIEARAGAIKHGIEMHNLRTRQGYDVTSSLHHLAQAIQQLKGNILNRYEAEARTLYYERKALESKTADIGGRIRDQDMEFVWRAEIEVLERRLHDWPDKSRPEFRRMVERKQLLQSELETLRQARANTETQAEPISDSRMFRHSDDYRSVNLTGRPFTLTSRQGQVVQLRHYAYERGTPEVGTQYILEKIESPSSRLRDTFRSNPDAWKTLVRAVGKKGTIRLNV
jgi:hypothetical protein